MFASEDSNQDLEFYNNKHSKQTETIILKRHAQAHILLNNKERNWSSEGAGHNESALPSTSPPSSIALPLIRVYSNAIMKWGRCHSIVGHTQLPWVLREKSTLWRKVCKGDGKDVPSQKNQRYYCSSSDFPECLTRTWDNSEREGRSFPTVPNQYTSSVSWLRMKSPPERRMSSPVDSNGLNKWS